MYFQKIFYNIMHLCVIEGIMIYIGYFRYSFFKNCLQKGKINHIILKIIFIKLCA